MFLSVESFLTYIRTLGWMPLALVVSLLFQETPARAQDTDSEEMICRDIGDIICLLEELAKAVALKASFSAKPPPQGPGQPGVGRTVVELQTDRRETKITGGLPGGPAEVSLISLNPTVNAWYLLKLQWNAQKIEWYHFDNVETQHSSIELNPSFPGGLWFKTAKGGEGCELWSKGGDHPLAKARQANAPYVGLCGDRIYLRNRIDGYRTTKEWVAEFLRAKVWGGEAITNIVKETVFKDSFLITSDPKSGKGPVVSQLINGPKTPSIGEKYRGVALPTKDLGIAVRNASNEEMEIGRWYRSRDRDSVYVSVIEPRAIEPELMKTHRSYVKDLDDVEMGAVSYLVAFDMSQLDMGFALGTDHPAVGWSERTLPEVRSPNSKGPDGFDSTEPVVRTGLIPPYLAERMVGIFTGGFKRDHGAFRWGDLARKNGASHYGFMENGVVLSSLHPELASLIVYKDGNVEIKTWTEQDNARQGLMRFVRQNGVAIVERDPSTGAGVPGKWVSNWTMGNWSGSQDRKFRTLRSGVCQQTLNGRRFIIYGYFSSMTPSAMARVFQAYGCEYAMHLDMNALEHTYMTLYAKAKAPDLTPQHLIKGMKVLDERFKGNVPRYIGYPDNRDFFYFMEKQQPVP